MKLKCDRAQLAEALSVVSRVVSTKSSLPALEGILLRAQGADLELIGYDLETGIQTTVPASIQEGGELVLPARMFLDIVKRMPGEFIELSVGNKYLTELKSGAAEYTILGMGGDEFPEFPSIGDMANIMLPQDTLKSMIEQTLFAIAPNDSKPVHTGSLFDLSAQGTVHLVSVDGFRLALRLERATIDTDLRFIVPGKALSELSRILEDSSETAQLFLSRRHIVIDVGGFKVYSRLLEGDFLDYRNAIPREGDMKVKVNVRELIDSIERTGLLISDRLKSPLRMSIAENQIQLSCSTALGKASDVLGCQLISGAGVEMGFNNRYLLDALRNAHCDEVLLEISGPLSPMKILPCEGDSFLFLVLPVRLKAE